MNTKLNCREEGGEFTSREYENFINTNIFSNFDSKMEF